MFLKVFINCISWPHQYIFSPRRSLPASARSQTMSFSHAGLWLHSNGPVTLSDPPADPLGSRDRESGEAEPRMDTNQLNIIQEHLKHPFDAATSVPGSMSLCSQNPAPYRKEIEFVPAGLLWGGAEMIPARPGMFRKAGSGSRCSDHPGEVTSTFLKDLRAT